MTRMKRTRTRIDDFVYIINYIGSFHTRLHFCCASLGVAVETLTQRIPTNPNIYISFVPLSPKRGATMLDPFAQLCCATFLHMVSIEINNKIMMQGWLYGSPLTSGDVAALVTYNVICSIP